MITSCKEIYFTGKLKYSVDLSISVDFYGFGEDYYCKKVWDEHKKSENIRKLPYDFCFNDSTCKGGQDIEVFIWFEDVYSEAFIQEKTAFFTIKIPADDACKGKDGICGGYKNRSNIRKYIA